MKSKTPSSLTVDTARLSAILETAVDGIITIKADGIVLSANKAVTQIFGYDLDELIDRNVSILMPSPDKDRHDDYLKRYLETGEGTIVGVGREVTGRRKDGSHFPIYLAVSHAEVEGTPLFTGIVRDITEVKRLEKSLRDANAAKTDFLSSMSHELRTPLNAILGFGQLILSDDKRTIDNDHRLYMENIVDAGGHLLSLVNDVLDLAKIESGSIDVTMKDIVIRDVAEECLPLIQAIGTKRQVTIRDISAGKQLPAVSGDAIRIKQILLNLLSNAVKYCDKGNTVDFDISDEGGVVRMMISNAGPGIPLDRQKEVFERFNRLNFSQSDIGGSGIGLSISKQLAEMMGGDINFESIPGERTSFWLDLPYGVQQLGVESRSPVNKDSSHKVLYVEDNPSNLRLMEHVISHIGGFSMISAHSLSWAMDILEMWEPDVILMDTNNNGCSDNLCAICERSLDDDIPIVVIAPAENELPSCPSAQQLRRVNRPIRPTEIEQALREATNA